MNTLDTLFICDLTLNAIIGVYPQERASKTSLCINIEIKTDLSRAITTDSIEESLSYEDIYNDVCHLVENSSFNLIETLAEAIATTCLTHSSVQQVNVSVEKPHIFPKAKSAGVKIQRSRK